MNIAAVYKFHFWVSVVLAVANFLACALNAAMGAWFYAAISFAAGVAISCAGLGLSRSFHRFRGTHDSHASHGSHDSHGT